MFEKGQKLRCIQGSTFSARLLTGNVYIAIKTTLAGVRLVDESGEKGEWMHERFIPFEWQAGDSFKIVKNGYGLKENHHGLSGKLLNKQSDYSPTRKCWDTNIPNPHYPGHYYYVEESQIEFIQPNGNTSVDVNPCATVTAFAAAPEPTGRRYLNKAV